MSILANYHTHTPRCLHATGTEEEYIQTAIQQGYDILGFSDHTPWPFPSYESYCRMPMQQLPEYVSTLRELQKKYADRIQLHLGLEAEYAPEYMDWLRGIKQEYHLDYLIFGNHFYLTEESGVYFGKENPDRALIDAYVEHTVKAMESGLYNYMAHPDLFLNRAPGIDDHTEKALRQICEAAVKYDMPLEYNLLGESRRIDEKRAEHGLCGYTCPDFWKIALEYPIRVIVGCDAHAPNELCRVPRLQQVQNELRSKGVTVLETLPL